MIDAVLVQCLELLKNERRLRFPLSRRRLYPRQSRCNLSIVRFCSLGHDFLRLLLRFLHLLGHSRQIALYCRYSRHFFAVGCIFTQRLLDIYADLLRQCRVGIGVGLARGENALPWCFEDTAAYVSESGTIASRLAYPRLDGFSGLLAASLFRPST